MEAEFWRKKLSLDPHENEAGLERLQRWLATGQLTWFLEDDQVCGFVRDAVERRAASGEGAQPRSPRILNAGSGPFAPRPLECELPSGGLPGGAGVEPAAAGQDGPHRRVPWPVPVVASDGLARFYNSVFDERGMTPPHTPLQCPSESLHTCFPLGHFDVVHMRNSLDHAFDPLLAITRMLQVARPGGWVLLRHARNEGVAGQFRNGLHQWAFDVEEGAERGAAFVIWSPELRVDVSAYLLDAGLAAEVRAALRAHPSPEENPHERYVWVEIRRPTAQEASGRLAAQASGGPGLDEPQAPLG
ncbi:unnamed protein product [Prorocentrum cordatum]|uniref:Methyltransferase type 11 domain-containing protein n=1 Tax=Prorocentrum cordatum TaxID=2364126 RepID=A0ABN9SZB2_9DINO|nr:unnamed protein product [Polarella glacialis]